MGNFAPSLRTALMWNEPVASMAAWPLANICCSGSDAVPVELGSKYGASCWYCLRVSRNQSSVTFRVPASMSANAVSVGMLFMTIELMSWPEFAGSPPGHAIGTKPAPLSFSQSARNPSQSSGRDVTPALAKASSL